MLFNSLAYIIFLPVVCGLYFLIPHRFRWLLLLAASYFFYMYWKPSYIILILLSTGLDYWCGRKMGGIEEKEQRKPYLYLSLFSNLAILGTFKYANFFIDQANTLLELMNLGYAQPALALILPMGVSFYTFQTMSYSIDVYHGRIKAESHLGVFALYVSFFPQLVAGPIERAGRLLSQLKEKHEFSYDNFVWGMNKIFYGAFKKVVVADRLALYVDQVYGQPESWSAGVLAMATFFFAIQIYCDFSGYSDIAIGSARILGIDLMENFRRPYLSKTVSEFWKRWHISLSTWFRDYLYIPLGGNRVVKWRWYYNLMITFVVSGFWHGANWTFIVWGGLHGAYLILGILTLDLRGRILESIKLNQENALMKMLEITGTIFLVCLAWVFFRAASVEDALFILNKIIQFGDYTLSLSAFSLVNGNYNFMISLIAIGMLGVSYLLPYNLELRYPRVFALICMLIIITLGVNGEQFIYFQF